MTTIAADGISRGGNGGFAPRHPADRGFFLGATLLLMAVIVAGFGVDLVQHVQAHQPAYPLIVHVHAAAMVSWLLLFAAQLGLIRAGRPDLHRKLGLAGVALAAAMIVLGPITAITVDTIKFDTEHEPPTFMAIQLVDIVAFAILAGSALLFRAAPAVHKRLMLLSLVEITDAGFARWPGILLEKWLGTAFGPEFLSFYAGNDLILLGIGAYDLITRKRLHPAYMAGAVLILGGQVLAIWLWKAPFWVGVSTHLIGR